MTRVSKDEIVLEVPLSHIMTSEVAKASAIGQQLLASGVELNSTHSYLACYIIQERHNPNSFWKPYLDVLPQGYRNMPIFFTQEELAYLKGHTQQAHGAADGSRVRGITGCGVGRAWCHRASGAHRRQFKCAAPLAVTPLRQAPSLWARSPIAMRSSRRSMIPSSSTSRPSLSIRWRVSDKGLLWQLHRSGRGCVGGLLSAGVASLLAHCASLLYGVVLHHVNIAQNSCGPFFAIASHMSVWLRHCRDRRLMSAAVFLLDLSLRLYLQGPHCGDHSYLRSHD